MVGVIYLVWPEPEPAATLSLPRYFVLRWFHGLLWVGLAAACFVRPYPRLGGAKTAKRLAVLAGLMYAIFFATVALSR